MTRRDLTAWAGSAVALPALTVRALAGIRLFGESPAGPCVRASATARDIEELVRILPLGTPITIS